MDEKFEALRRRWYSHPYIQYNIINAIKHREAVFLQDKIVIRCVKANATQYLDKNFRRYEFLTRPFNLYASLAHYPNLPMFSFNIAKKKVEQAEFNTHYRDYITGYDFLIDIDNENLPSAFKSMKKVKAIFDEHQVPATYCFSGKKGFHVRVDYEDFPPQLKSQGWQEIADTLKAFTERFRLVENIPDIDCSIYDLRRIAKTPYSVVYPYYFIAMPLTDSQIDNFNLEEMSIITQLANVEQLRNRNTKLEGSPDGFRNLLDTYMVQE